MLEWQETGPTVLKAFGRKPYYMITARLFRNGIPIPLDPAAVIQPLITRVYWDGFSGIEKARAEIKRDKPVVWQAYA